MFLNIGDVQNILFVIKSTTVYTKFSDFKAHVQRKYEYGIVLIILVKADFINFAHFLLKRKYFYILTKYIFYSKYFWMIQE